MKNLPVGGGGGGEEEERNAGKNKLQKSYFEVLGICCPSEVPLVENILKPLEGVKDVAVIVPTRTVVVLHDSLLISQFEIVKALNRARLEANVKVKGAKTVKRKWPSPYAMASGACLLLSFLKYVFHPLHWLALAAVAFGIIPILLRAVAALRNHSFGDINILVVITVVGSIALKDYWEAGTIVFLFAIADWLESLASHKATAAMSSLLNLAPQKAILAETGQEVDVSEVKMSSILAVKEGEMIPIDGVVIEGNCEVDEKTLTGESFPVTKQKDSSVLAGTINVNGYISVRTTALAEDCVVARMTKLVEEAQNNKSNIERYMEKFAKYYTPGIVLISAFLAIVPAILRVHNQKKWYHIALVVLVSACPCALILSTPVAMFCALTKAAKLGVFFKGADYLEMLARVKVMAFDKTGTITRAEFEVTEFRPLVEEGISLKTMLYWVSSIESMSSHPMAAVLVDLAKSHSIEPKPEMVEQFQNFPGEGIYGKIDGRDIYIGNRKLSSRAGCHSVPKLEGNLDEGKSVGYIFLGSNPIGIFCLADVCRTGAKEALKELKSMGIKNIMITGDGYAAAKYAEEQLGGALDVVHADLLPEDKARIIRDSQKQACTAMIGDGINDAPALATADVGISMGVSGSSLAAETGHVILMTNDIQKIPKVAKLARKVKAKIVENIILSVVTKSAIVALAAAGHPIVWAAVLADVGTCLLVTLNSMLILGQTVRHRKPCCRSTGKKHQQKCSGSEGLHGHQPCCQDKESQNHCEAQRCSSKHCAPASIQQFAPMSSISESTNKHGCCGHDNQNQKTKRSDHSTKKLADDSSTHDEECQGSDLSHGNHGNQLCCHDQKPKTCCEVQVQACSSKPCAPGNQNVPTSTSSSSCGKTTHSSELNGKQSCGHSNQIRKAKCSDHGSCKSNAGHQGPSKHHHGGTECCNSTKRMEGSDLGKSQMTSSREDNIISDDELGRVVKFCCNHDPTKHNHEPKGKNHEAECGHSNHSSGHHLGHNHVHCNTILSCMALENRHVGGCCESFRKECCVHDGHFGTNFRGGLAEIVIE